MVWSDTALAGVTKSFPRFVRNIGTAQTAWANKIHSKLSHYTETAGTATFEQCYLYKLLEPFDVFIMDSVGSVKTYACVKPFGSGTPSVAWSLNSTYMPGAGGQDETAGSGNNYSGGVGGCILIKYYTLA
jgi:hypothetical protein